MNCCFCTKSCAITKLEWCQIGTHSLHLLAVLATRRCKVQPTAIGLVPLSFFVSAVSEAPNREGHISIGTVPLSTRLVKAVSARSSRVPPAPAEALVMSCRCWDGDHLDHCKSLGKESNSLKHIFSTYILSNWPHAHLLRGLVAERYPDGALDV